MTAIDEIMDTFSTRKIQHNTTILSIELPAKGEACESPWFENIARRMPGQERHDSCCLVDSTQDTA